MAQHVGSQVSLEEALGRAIRLHESAYPGSFVYSATVTGFYGPPGRLRYSAELRASHFSQPVVYEIEGVDS